MKNNKLSIEQVRQRLGVKTTKAVYALLDRKLLTAERDDTFNRLYVTESELKRYQQVRRPVGAPKKIIAE